MSIREAFRSQSISCKTLGSPFMARLMALAAKRLTDKTGAGQMILDWPGDPSSSADSVPLRFGGALHRLVLMGEVPELAAVYGQPGDDGHLWALVEQTMMSQDALMQDFMRSPPQTNEIRRSAALVPALHLIAGETGHPLALMELGASAGLNLLCDHFHLSEGGAEYGPPDSAVRLTPDCEGTPPPPASLTIISREGVDLRPFDLSDPGQQLRLLSYLWPDQPDRVRNTRAALDMAAHTPVAIAEGDAITWLEGRLDAAPEGQTRVIYHTVAWQYFPASVQARGEALIARAGEMATPTAPLARFSMEADGQGPGAAMQLTLWPDGRTRTLGRVDFHGRWIRWT